MRLIIGLLTIYFVSLALLPCSDIGSNALGEAAHFSQSQPVHGDCEDCSSPFCIVCSAKNVIDTDYKCCYTISTTVMTLSLKTPQIDSKPKTDYYGNIWIPPKITV